MPEEIDLELSSNSSQDSYRSSQDSPGSLREFIVDSQSSSSQSDSTYEPSQSELDESDDYQEEEEQFAAAVHYCKLCRARLTQAVDFIGSDYVAVAKGPH